MGHESGARGGYVAHMPIRDTLQTTALTLGELFANGARYAVPRFQRNYSWGPSEWSDLWGDIAHAEAKDVDHYLGAIVLQAGSDEDDPLWVIDGQQRLATLSILTLALIAQLEDWASAGQQSDANRERAALFRERLVAPRDATSLKRTSRLRLNDHDDPFFQSALVNGHLPANPQRLTGSERALWQCWTFFQGQVSQRFEASDGAVLAAFIDRVVSRRLLFIQIVVDDESAAYTVFETLNARGVALGTADLLKNYVFSLAASGGTADLEEMQRMWARLVSTVPLGQVADLAHHLECSWSSTVQKRSLFRHLRGRVTTRTEAFAYLGQLVDAADWYAALLDPHDTLWTSMPEVRESVRVLSMLGVEQYRSLALVACPAIRDDSREMSRLFRLFVMVSLRASVVTPTPSGDVHHAWSRAAAMWREQSARTVSAVVKPIAAMWPDDPAFKNAFATLRIPARGPGKKRVRYLLAELERDASGKAVDWETGDFTVEHILPDRPGGAWDDVSEHERERFVCWLGNYVPLEASLNRALGNASFDVKRAAYAQSAYALPRHIEASTWNGEAIRRQAAHYAKRAAHIWRFDGLG